MDLCLAQEIEDLLCQKSDPSHLIYFSLEIVLQIGLPLKIEQSAYRQARSHFLALILSTA
ncbi:hypothetical protein BN1263200005 [Stenotrophomonas maltophilia]|nr:hypothetical protein BN1263200005 [Stenotrophomonas maltophilia]